MKDKRLDALLAILLPGMMCRYYNSYYTPTCIMDMEALTAEGKDNPTTQCNGDIRKCEREE